MKLDRTQALVLAAFAAVYVIWGATYLGIRIAIGSMPPLFMAGTRFLVAGGVLYAFLRLRGAGRPTRAHIGSAVVTGFLMLVMGNGGVTIAEQTVDSGIAALIVALVPVWMAAMEAARSRMLPGRRVLGGLALGVAGIALLLGPGQLSGARIGPGALLIVLGTMCWSAGSLWGRAAPRPSSPLLGTALTMLTGGALFTLLSLATGDAARFDLAAVTAEAWLAWAFLVVLGSIVAFSAYVWLLQQVPAARVATYAFVNPVVAVLLGWAFAGEAIGPRTLAAAGLIVGG
ncbi:MAG: EamA family transporter, partial [Halobacteriales archaeon]|nr:EamA family transporter [Halobacteriales archaeon]